MAISVSIIEDDPGIRGILETWVRSSAPEILFLDSYMTGEAALEGLPQKPADVVLSDINLPGMDGIECVRRLKATLPQTNFVMVTVYLDPAKLFQALSAGATGYLVKRTNQEELLRAIQEVHAGGSPMSSRIARFVVDAFHQSSQKSTGLEELSKRETEVLESLARGRRYKEIADELSISFYTVNTLVRRIYEKLQVHTRSQAIKRFQESEFARTSARRSRR